MKSPALSNLDPSIVVSVLSGCAVLATLGASRSFARTIALVLKVCWLYLANNR